MGTVIEVNPKFGLVNLQRRTIHCDYLVISALFCIFAVVKANSGVANIARCRWCIDNGQNKN